MTVLKNVDSVFALLIIVSLSLRYYGKNRNYLTNKGLTSALLSVLGAVLWLLFIRITSDVYIALFNNAVTLVLFFCSVLLWRARFHDLGISLRTDFREL
jgi:hypothetical protein